MTVEGIEIIISGFDQPLPVEIDWLWSVSKNKIALQQLFTKRVLNKIKSEQFDKPLFLCGSHKENDAMDLVEVLPAINALTGCDTAKLVQKAELSGKELVVTTYCTHLAGMHWLIKWLLMLRSFSKNV